ncbi:MAG: hypothetical protein IPL58_10870 [Betaproteobacteria bacterium]|uniref:Uncharacterized protein n=1 Tax=Candidatus Proximibacter danicus TaxID=2954365 RepID=A0A9D7K337_9PROT|nr:hypothetical protein [Candidatus Proximibacter danicus]
MLGEMLAITAVIMVMMFVFAHMDQPDRLWHMIPPWGYLQLLCDARLGRAGAQRLPVPQHRLRLLLSVGEVPAPRSTTGSSCRSCISRSSGRSPYIPSRLLISHHAVTSDVVPQHDANPLHHDGVCGGPALIILIFLIITKNTKFWIEDGAINLLSTIVTWSSG